MFLQLALLAFHPQTLRIAARAAPTIIRAIPASQLAKLGLTRVSGWALGPVVGGAVGGVVLTTLAFPQSRKWVIERGKLAADWLRTAVIPADPLIQPVDPFVQDVDASESQQASTPSTGVSEGPSSEGLEGHAEESRSDDQLGNTGVH